MIAVRFGLTLLAAAISPLTIFAAGNELIANGGRSYDYVNFAGTGSGIAPSDTLPGGQKFLTLKIRNTNRCRLPPPDAYCYEIGTEAAGVPTMDTRIWMRNADGSLVSLSDDVGGSKFAHLYVYVDCVMGPSSRGAQDSIELLIAAKSPADNNGDFKLVKAPAIGYGCYPDAPDPYVFVDKFGVQLYHTN